MGTRFVHPSSAPLTAPDPKKAKVRFDGSCCLNLRSITGALELLEGTSGNKTSISTAELTSVLWFVEMCVMSSALYFDGTVPKEDLAAATDKTGELATRYQLKELEIEPIRILNGADILHNAKLAVLESSFLLADVQLDPNVDQAVKPAEHETFRKALQSADGLDEDSRESLALELIDKNFRGGKCVAAMVAAGPDALTLAQTAYDAHPAVEGPRVTGALINRFRLNYLNQLASWRSGAYAADPGFEALSDQHRRLFHQYLLGKVVNEIDTGKANILVENMKQSTPLPPIGLFALMVTREKKKPIAILLTALNYFKYDTALQKMMWRTTEEGIRLPQRDPDLKAYNALVTEQFKQRYNQLDEKAEGIVEVGSSGSKFRKFVIPTVLDAAASFIPLPGVGALGAVFKVLGNIAIGTSTNALAELLTAGGGNSYITQYLRLQRDFKKTEELAQPISAIAGRVEEVFGRSLA
jgi:hypothetical protein